MNGSDCCGSCIIVVGLCSLHDADRLPVGQSTALPVPVQRVCRHARVFDHAGLSGNSRLRSHSYCLPIVGFRRRPEENVIFAVQWLACLPLCQRFVAYLAVRISRMTRGQCGSLLLHCKRLPLSTLCRFYRRPHCFDIAIDKRRPLGSAFAESNDGSNVSRGVATRGGCLSN